MDKVPWNRVILDEFFSLALLTPEEEKIIRTRAAGWSQCRQCHAYGMSLATLNRIIKKAKQKYDFVKRYSDVLPENLNF